MALQDSIGDAIVAMLSASPFVTTYWPSGAVAQGFDLSRSDNLGKYNRAVLRPVSAIPLAMFDDSAQVSFRFELLCELAHHENPETLWTGVLGALHTKFGDGGTLLYAAIAALTGGVPATLKGGGVTVEIGEPFGDFPGTTDDDFETNRERFLGRVPLTVTAWQTI